MLKSRLRSREDVDTLRDRYLGPREDLTSILINARQEQKSTFGALLAPIFAAAAATRPRDVAASDASRGSTPAAAAATPVAAAPRAAAAVADAATVVSATPGAIAYTPSPARLLRVAGRTAEPRRTGTPYATGRDPPRQRRVSTMLPTSGVLPLVIRRHSASDDGGDCAVAALGAAEPPLVQVADGSVLSPLRDDAHHAGSDSEDLGASVSHVGGRMK